MHAETVELLATKGRFPTEQALAIAEAIDVGISNAQLVTVPVLDARFAALEGKIDTRFETFKADIERRFERLRMNLVTAVVTIIAAHAAFGPVGVAALKAIRSAW
jgi:hypothetical protein